MNEEQLSPKEQSVHVALALAAAETQRNRQACVMGSFRVEQSVKTRVEEICALHGTTSSAFYRMCAHLLIEAYGGAPEESSPAQE